MLDLSGTNPALYSNYDFHSCYQGFQSPSAQYTLVTVLVLVEYIRVTNNAGAVAVRVWSAHLNSGSGAMRALVEGYFCDPTHAV